MNKKQKKFKLGKINGNTYLLMITILLFVVMYVAGMIVFEDRGFAKPQMFLNLFMWWNYPSEAIWAPLSMIREFVRIRI